MKRLCALVFLLLYPVSPVLAQGVYTKLDLDKDCVFHSSYEAGASAYCSGYKGYPVHFSEGDLRQMVRFGHIAKLDGQWESFGQFNHAGNTIEWLLNEDKPYATILRWFIENTNDNGEVTPDRKGQVLVISSVGSHENPVSCTLGYVDARSNNNANTLAREVAADLASTFQCGQDKPEFHGVRGELAGDPSSYFE